MRTPALEHIGGSLYLIDSDGTKWRVHDVHFTGGKRRRVSLGSTRANHRYFVAVDGTKRAVISQAPVPSAKVPDAPAQRGMTFEVHLS